MTKHHHLPQPQIFKLACVVSMCERFGFYVLADIFVLYLKSQYLISDELAFTLFGVFTTLVYVTPAVGGYLADHVFGIRRCIILGLFLEGVGLALLAVPNKSFLPFGLACIILGVGFFKTGPTDLMARAYKDGDPRIDSGFTLFYMMINIGGFFASIAAGLIYGHYGWRPVFLCASSSLFLGLIVYYFFRRSAKPLDVKFGQEKLPMKRLGWLIFGVLSAVIIVMFLIKHTFIAELFFFAAAISIVLYFLFEIARSSHEEKLKIVACLVLITMGLAFFTLYFQAYTSISLFIKRNVVRQVFGFEIPTAFFIGLNPFWILVLAPLLAWLYRWLNRHGKDFAVTTKFPLGLLVASLCFFSLVLSTHFANADMKVSPLWIVFVYFLYSLGELLISALGVAMVTHIAPKRLYGVMMGAWFLIACGLAASLSGMFAGLANIPEGLFDPVKILHIYRHAFLVMGWVGLGATIVAFAVSPYLKKIAQLG